VKPQKVVKNVVLVVVVVAVVAEDAVVVVVDVVVADVVVVVTMKRLGMYLCHHMIHTFGALTSFQSPSVSETHFDLFVIFFSMNQQGPSHHIGSISPSW
jgi:hypothetical protein